MHKLFNFSNKHPLIAIIIILVGGLLAAFQAGKIYIDSSPSSMMMRNDPNRLYYTESLEKFTSDNVLAVYVEDPELFTPEKLGYLEEFIQKIDRPEEFPDINRIESLFSVNNIKGSLDSLDTGPLMETAPETREEALAIQKNALENPIFERNLISESGNATMINIYLTPIDPSREEDATETVLKVREILEGDGENPGYADHFKMMFEIGRPYMSEQITTIILHDMTLLIPAAFIILMVMLTLTMGSLTNALLPILTSGLSILYTFGFMGVLGIPLNLVTFIVPILVIVIGSSEDVHILASYKEIQLTEKNPDRAIRKLSITLGTAVVLTSLTTFLGFLSISINEITALIQFGITAGFAMFINPITTFLLSPLYLKYFIKDGNQKKSTRVDEIFNRLSGRIITLINKKGRRVLLILLGSAVLIAGFSFLIEVDNDTKGFFKTGSELKQRLTIMEEEMAGTASFQVVIWRESPPALPEVSSTGEIEKGELFDSEEEDLLLFENPEEDPGFMEDEISLFAESEDFALFDDQEINLMAPEETESLPLFKDPLYLDLLDRMGAELIDNYDLDKIISISDYIKMLNREMNVGLPGEFNRIPDPADPLSANLIAQYVINLHREEIEPYVTADWSEARMIIKHNLSSSRTIQDTVAALENEIRRIINETDPGLSFKITGENLLINEAADSITRSQVLGLGLLLTTIFIIMSILFMNIRAGLLSLIPNLFPVFLFFGIMGIFHIPLNLGTCMVAAIAIGLSVDDTIHFMTSFNREMRSLQDSSAAVTKVMQEEIRPIISTSISLILSFVILTLAQLMPLVYFGILSGLVILGALLADLLITPILLSRFQVVNITDLYNLKLAEELMESPVFRDMSMNEIKRFVLMGKVCTKDPGENIINTGEWEQKIYILLSGKVSIVREAPDNGEPLFLTSIGTGAILGEISLLRNVRRTATVTALEEVTFLEIDWSGLERLEKHSKSISMKLYRNIAAVLGNRLVDMTDKVITLQKEEL